MSTFKLPRQAGLTLDDIKAATAAYASQRGYVEEASSAELRGVGARVVKAGKTVSAAKKGAPHKGKTTKFSA